MRDQLPPPFVSTEVDLTDFKFMPLEVSRLLRSEFWMDAMDRDPRIAAASVNLWAESWHQRPAASLPDNDRAMARFAMVDRETWAEIRDGVLAAWVKCADGRWYHPVVAEKANAAWEEKVAYLDRKRRWKESGQRGGQKRAQANLEGSLAPTLEGTLEPCLAGTLEGTLQAKEEKRNGNGKGEGKGKGKGLTYPEKEEHIPPADAAGEPVRVPMGEGYTPAFEAWWKLYPRKDEKGAAFRAFKNALKLVPLETLMAGVRAYAAQKRRDPTFIKHAATWLNGHCWNDEPPPTPTKPKNWFPGYVPMGPHGG